MIFLHMRFVVCTAVTVKITVVWVTLQITM